MAKMKASQPAMKTWRQWRIRKRNIISNDQNGVISENGVKSEEYGGNIQCRNQ
jgi:hypothetical protein